MGSAGTRCGSQPCLAPTDGHRECVLFSSGQNTSLYVRGMPYHSSKPRFVGRRASARPRCHLPHIPVAYPCADKSCASVISHVVSPSATPPLGTWYVPDRIGNRPVSSAERDGVHCASTLKFSRRSPSLASRSIRGVGAPRRMPPP